MKEILIHYFIKPTFCVYLTKNLWEKFYILFLSELDRRPISCYFHVIASFEGSGMDAVYKLGAKNQNI